jgi:hypothetical protein
MYEVLEHDARDYAEFCSYAGDEWPELPIPLATIPASAGLALELEFGIEPFSDMSDARLESVTIEPVRWSV